MHDKRVGRGNSLLALSAGPPVRHPVRPHRSSRALLADLRQVFFELFSTGEVFPNLALDQDFRPLVLLIYMFDSGILLALQHSGREDRQTFKCKHEIVEGILVLFVRLGVILFLILLDCNLNELDRTLKIPSARCSWGTVI